MLVSQDARRVEVWRRTAAGAWSHAVHAAGQTLELASVGGGLSVDGLYSEAGLDVP